MTARLRLLRIFLLFAAFAWGVSVYGVFASWPDVVARLQGLGAGPIPDDRMLNYWLRMASGAFTLVGLVYLLLAIAPRRYANVIPVMGWLMVVEGIILLVHGSKLELPPFPFFSDTAACIFGGGGILWFGQAART